MAKIAVLFLLVALVAICNGARLRRDEPKAPEVGIDLQPVIAALQNVFSAENADKLQKQTNDLIARTKTETDENLQKLADFGQELLNSLKAKLAQPK